MYAVLVERGGSALSIAFYYLCGMVVKSRHEELCELAYDYTKRNDTALSKQQTTIKEKQEWFELDLHLVPQVHYI